MPMLVNVYPRLESERFVDELYEPVMRFLAPGFDDLRTVGTLRDHHLLWTPDLAIGKVISDHWALYLHFGYEAGKVRTKSNDVSIFLLPLHNDFEIFRSAAYVGLCADLFPWGMPERRKYDGLWDRLSHAKPSIGFRLTETYAGYEAKAKIGITGLPNFLSVNVKDNWWVTSFNANLGADVPITANAALSLNAGFNYSFQRHYDFDGAEFTLAWKQYFK